MEHLREPSTRISDLPTDVVYEILRSCSSTTDLFAAIRSCKHIYGIWRGHPNTILRTVICTQLDMDEDTFPVAFGAVLHWETARTLRLFTEDELLPTRLDYALWNRFASNHDTVESLEKEFSKRMKNSSYGYSVLTPLERRRFHTAAYLFQQFHALFGIDADGSFEPWKYESPPPNQLTRVSFLETFPTTWLLHLSAFKDYVLRWADVIYKVWEDEGRIDGMDPDLSLSPDQFRHLILSTGLHWYFDGDDDDIMQACARADCFDAKRGLWLTDDLNNVISVRGVTLEQTLSDDAKLVIAQGELFTVCQRCDYEMSGDCYNNTNYEEAADLIVPSSLLPGQLPQNIAETERITKRFPDWYNTPQCIPVNIIRELLDPCPTASSPLDNDMASPDVDNQTAVPEPPLEVLSPSDPTQNYVYNPRHMLCLMCFTEELSMRFWGWWLRERKLPPVSAPVQENCCLGFSCVQQRRANHARKMDHCCHPPKDITPSHFNWL